MAAANTATRAALHGTVTALVVALRIVAALAEVAADVLRRIADLIAAGRGTGNGSKTTPATGQLSLTP